MRVLIDAHMVGKNEGGNERYIASLIEALGKRIEIVAIVGSPDIKIRGAYKTVFFDGSNLARYLFQIPSLMKKERCELVLTTYFASPLSASRNVVMVHDLLPLRRPDYFSVKERLQFWCLGVSIYLARAVIVPSKFVKQEVGYFYPSMESKVSVIPEAASSGIKPFRLEKRKILRERMQIDREAVLVVLSKYQKRPLKPIKKALEQVKRRMIVYLLNIPGNEADKLEGKHEYRPIQHLTNKELVELYQAVDLVVYGSRYEGFGLPVLEAIQSGTPLLTTRIPPIVEMLGDDESRYFELDKPATLTRQIENLWKNGQRVYNVAKRYSWDKTARSTEKLFVSLVVKK